MKQKIFSLIALVAGLFVMAPTVFAQGVVYDKWISGPDSKGVYTINLEAYVTGSKITTETLMPMDIVLCLAYNNSLLGYGAESLRKSVATFINIIQEKDIVKDETGQPTGERVGYRIAIDFYGVKSLPQGVPPAAINTLHPVSMYNAQVSDNDGIVTYNGSPDIFPRATSHMNGNEKANAGLERAYDILYGTGAETQDNPVVVFFTNGTPGAQSGSGWNSGQDTQQAKNAIDKAYPIKRDGATLVAVGLYEEPASPDNMTDWLYLTSSDNVDENGIPNPPGNFPSNPRHNVTGVNSVIGSVNELVSIFSAIASSIGGDYNIGSASSVLLDIVATSFTISTNADLGSTTVWRVPCNDSQGGLIQHSFNEAAKEQLSTVATVEALDLITNPTQREKTVCLSVDGETGEVEVTGFDYGANWCGWEDDDITGYHGPHGYKLLLQIPITANTDAVGGPNVATNTPDSGLTIKDDEGNIVDEYTFISPKISLPVNVHIKKEGLKPGESAKFMIQKARIPASGDISEIAEEDWEYVSTVFVTNGPYAQRDKGDPVVKVRGLPANEDGVDEENNPVRYNLIYRISEEEWSWSYTLDTEPQFTDTQHVDNPFLFSNTERDNIDVIVRHAETKATNIFKPGVVTGNVHYDDSKLNNRGGTPSE